MKSFTLFSLCLLLSACASLSNDQMNAVVAAEQESLRECADSSKHELNVEITVNPDGSVGGVGVEGAEGSASSTVAACVERVIRTWDFPEASVSTSAALPLTIEAAPSEPESAGPIQVVLPSD